MVSVVITEVMQFTILTVTSITIGVIAIYKVSPEMIQHAIPAGWTESVLRLETRTSIGRAFSTRSTTPSNPTATNCSASCSA